MKSLIKIGWPFVAIFLVLFIGCQNVVYENPTVVKVSVISNDGNRWSGTGFFIKDDLIVTAGHVVRDASSIIIQYQNGKKLNVDFWKGGLDNGIDIGIIRIKTPEKENTLIISKVDLSDSITIIGYSNGRWYCISKGEVCAIDIDIEFFGNCLYILTDVHINRGHSGSPVLNNKGEIVGIVIGMVGNFSVIIPIDNLYKVIDK